MKKSIRTALVITAIALTVLMTAAYFSWGTAQHMLPATFVMHLEQDSTSSGGNRYTNADLSYVESKLVHGSLTYTSGRETATVLSCTFEHSQWITSGGAPCTISFIALPQTRDEAEQLIAAGQIKPAGDSCRHFDICFTVEK